MLKTNPIASSSQFAERHLGRLGRFASSALDRRRAARRVSAFTRILELPSPLSLDKLLRFVELVTERPIQLSRRDDLLDVDMSGFWHEGEDVNRLFHVGDRSEFAGEMNILHEISHVLLQHDPEPLTGEELAVVFPDLDPRKVLHGWRHTKLRTGIEAEAELLADHLYAEIRSGKREEEILGFGDVIG
jgi:hypothetical protein